MFLVISLAFSLYTLTTAKQVTAGTSSSTETVTIQNFAFSPPEIDISPGMTVVWINNDSTTHTTTSDMRGAESWNSGNLAPGQSFSWVFRTVGSYSYHCAIHPSMHGTVRVVQTATSMTNLETYTAPTPTSSATKVSTSMTMPSYSPNPLALNYNQSASSNESTEYKSPTYSPQPSTPSSYSNPSRLPNTGPPIEELALFGLIPLGLILKNYAKEEPSKKTSFNLWWKKRTNLKS